MNKALVAIIVIALGGIAGWYFLNTDSIASSDSVQVEPTAAVAQDSETSAPSYDSASGAAGTKGGAPLVSTKVTVTFSENGFSPAIVTVKKGTTVSFYNGGTTTMWVVSDVHPTHQLLPGFDAKKGFVNGTMYEYVFAKVGTWTYHNHLQPTQTGTVVVTE